MKFNLLTPEEERVIEYKATEMPFTGKYYKNDQSGTYLCKRCNTPLFSSRSKFDSGTGWPSFDNAIPGAVKQIPDADQHRTEIVCAKCNAHLGHIFTGEGFTPSNLRFCVNSVSLDFKEEKALNRNIETAIFAAGCFWGVEYHFKKANGVVSVSSGYTGGSKKNPSYIEVSTGRTGHAEAVEVTYDPTIISYDELVKLFFEIHDFTQTDGQGPDIGTQYRSAIFYKNDVEKQTAEKYFEILKKKGYSVATELASAEKFWKAEEYHQDYYNRNGSTPYCHIYKKIF